MREVRVSLVRRDDLSYSALIGQGILRDVLADVERLHARRRIFLVTDANVVAAGHAATLRGGRAPGLWCGRSVPQYVINPPGEVSKNIDTVIRIVDAMEAQKLGRDSLLVHIQRPHGTGEQRPSHEPHDFLPKSRFVAR